MRANHCSSANVTSRIPEKGKPCLLTCIAGDKEYGRAFLKLSELLKSGGTSQISAVVILETDDHIACTYKIVAVCDDHS